jgi:hypothetical protein
MTRVFCELKTADSEVGRYKRETDDSEVGRYKRETDDSEARGD